MRGEMQEPQPKPILGQGIYIAETLPGAVDQNGLLRLLKHTTQLPHLSYNRHGYINAYR